MSFIWSECWLFVLEGKFANQSILGCFLGVVFTHELVESVKPIRGCAHRAIRCSELSEQRLAQTLHYPHKKVKISSFYLLRILLVTILVVFV